MEIDFSTPLPVFPPDFRSGFASLVGRPNAGKSTLTNALVGQKVAITSNRPQTTRHTIRGIVHKDDYQLILVDTPGIHRPRTLLGERLNDLVAGTLSQVDVLGFCIPADEKIGPGDRYIASQLVASSNKPVVAIVTKADKVNAEQLSEQLLAVAALGEEVMSAERAARAKRAEHRAKQRAAGKKVKNEKPVAFAKGTGPAAQRESGHDIDEPMPNDGKGGWAAIIPVSAVQFFQVEAVADLLSQYIPLSPPLYPEGELTDEPEETLIAELVREAALEGARDELPHSIAVTVDEMNYRAGRPKDKPLLDVHVSLYVERESQKAIVIGKGGQNLRKIGMRARAQMEALLGERIFLDIHVKIAKEWQSDPRALNRLGF
ncbi:MAG: GTPase Era [Rothia sp. (in: high G+C Gram-positive bacteria)]|uniref:GTPase Era n=1 Tax=Rothia sp. (in: high G+C Gram-positive bacteria) TaxID=1885016 RepID=UPI0026DF0663|nr:GTPase Era [Rothia sp. (in: high G+C Gram-positive bacteria)]MDO5750628.1 GTPase Era [Rothia sp. (in: high G+C Gram-positive bacteria)]